MKKTLKFISLILAAVLFAACFFACGDDENPKSGQVTVVIAGAEEKAYTIDLGTVEITEGALSLVKHLNATQGLEYEMNGTMLKKIGSLKEDASTGTYVYLWTNVEKDFDVSEGAPENKTWNGHALTPSGVGISDMTVKDGAVIYISTTVFGS